MNLVKINGVPLLGSRSQTVSLRYKVTIASFQFKGVPRFLFLAFGRDRNMYAPNANRRTINRPGNEARDDITHIMGGAH